MRAIVPVVLCGGSGTRLWPRSRASKPKPFVPLLGDRSLYEATLARCDDRNTFTRPIIVVGESYLALARQQADELAPDALFLVEPLGRNTAPAIALAALALEADDVMMVCPSDHRIANSDAFIAAALNARELASSGSLVSFGIEATAPETGYGYIKRGEALGPGYRIEEFVEKPDLDTALTFLADGNYVWNGGIFAFRVGTFLEELGKHRPNLLAGVQAAFDAATRDGRNIRPDETLFSRIDGESVDYAVMENTGCAAMVDVSMGWSDIGNWDALYRERAETSEANVIIGPGEIIGASGTMIDTDGPHVTVVGADNLVIVVDKDDVMVVSRDAAQQVSQASRCKSQ